MACYINRNLRYGKAGKLGQSIVIRTRGYLKKYINKNIDTINQLDARTIKLKHAGMMKLYMNDYIDRWLYTGADFEPHVVRLFQQFVKKDYNVIDIGANIGYFSLIASHLAGKNGCVYSFEPSPFNLGKLHENLRLNQVENVHVFNYAVSNKKGVATFHVPVAAIKNSGRSSLRKIEEQSTTIDVETITVDSLLSQLKKIDLVKMDIEGAEGLALRGMTQLIERDHPVFIMELSDLFLKQLDSSAEDVIHFFESREYTIYTAGEEITKFNYAAEKYEQCDILCIHQYR